MRTPSQLEAQRRYETKCQTFIFRLNREKDMDIIEKIKSEPCMTEYFRNLIRRDMGK